MTEAEKIESLLERLEKLQDGMTEKSVRLYLEKARTNLCIAHGRSLNAAYHKKFVR